MARFQFSLRTLLLCAITIGALTGLYFSRRKTQAAKFEIAKLNDDFGVLEIADPTKAYARATPMDVNEPGAMRFRIYVPRAGHFRVGVQTSEVVPGAIDRKRAEFTEFSMAGRGEFQIDVMVVAELEGNGMYKLRITKISEVAVELVRTIDWKKTGFNSYHVYAEVPIFKSTEFDLSKPLILATLKTMIVSSTTATGSTSSRTNLAGPGFMLVFEEEPQKP